MARNRTSRKGRRGDPLVTTCTIGAVVLLDVAKKEQKA